MSDYYTESQINRIEEDAYNGAIFEAGKEWERQRDEFDSREYELQSRIAELEAERRWIPVSERLPEKGNLVIGITDYCGYVFFEIVDDDGQGIVLHPYRRCQGKVTHWMPLPEPPEVK